MIFPNTDEIFVKLENAGLRIIVTYPERNWLLCQKPERLEAWVHQGAFLQVTGQSLLGFFGSAVRKFAEFLLGKGWAHLLASDARDTKHRPPPSTKPGNACSSPAPWIPPKDAESG